MPNDTIFSLIELFGSPCTSEIRLQLDQAAANHLPVLLYGETGVGKDVWAAYLHARKGTGPFVSLHCADIPEQLLESQWFGYTKGAFTGASTDHPGLWQNAQNGLLYLNRIDLLKPDIQSKLLRVIERKRYFPLGSTQERSIAAQFVFSTAEDIHNQVATGQFRADLYYRISAFAIRIPPLRERKEDIVPLLKHFAARQNAPIALQAKAWETLCNHPWPGNIRELENFVNRCVISAGCLNDHSVHAHLEQGSFLNMTKAREPNLQEMEHLYINHLLQRYKNKTHVAHILGISRKTLYNKLRTYGKD